MFAKTDHSAPRVPANVQDAIRTLIRIGDASTADDLLGMIILGESYAAPARNGE